MKHARGKLELRCQPQCLASFNVMSAGKPVAQFEEHKTKYACIVEADESMRKRMEGSHHENHEDHIAGKGMNSLHTFIPMPRFRRGIDEARKEGRKVHFASLMDISHLKNAELETKHQKYKGRVVLRGDIVKDDSGSYAVFTERGSSASQMTAAKVMDIISRLPGCAGQAADAENLFTPSSKWSMHPNY